MFEADLDVFLRDFGVDCAFDGKPFRALFDRPGESVSYGGSFGARSTAYRITLRTDVGRSIGLIDGYGDAIEGQSVIVGGGVYETREGGMLDDGAFSGIDLTKRGNDGR